MPREASERAPEPEVLDPASDGSETKTLGFDATETLHDAPVVKAEHQEQESKTPIVDYCQVFNVDETTPDEEIEDRVNEAYATKYEEVLSKQQSGDIKEKDAQDLIEELQKGKDALINHRDKYEASFLLGVRFDASQNEIVESFDEIGERLNAGEITEADYKAADEAAQFLLDDSIEKNGVESQPVVGGHNLGSEETRSRLTETKHDEVNETARTILETAKKKGLERPDALAEDLARDILKVSPDYDFSEVSKALLLAKKKHPEGSVEFESMKAAGNVLFRRLDEREYESGRSFEIPLSDWEPKPAAPEVANKDLKSESGVRIDAAETEVMKPIPNEVVIDPNFEESKKEKKEDKKEAKKELDAKAVETKLTRIIDKATLIFNELKKNGTNADVSLLNEYLNKSDKAKLQKGGLTPKRVEYLKEQCLTIMRVAQQRFETLKNMDANDKKVLEKLNGKIKKGEVKKEMEDYDLAVKIRAMGPKVEAERQEDLQFKEEQEAADREQVVKQLNQLKQEIDEKMDAVDVGPVSEEEAELPADAKNLFEDLEWPGNKAKEPEESDLGDFGKWAEKKSGKVKKAARDAAGLPKKGLKGFWWGIKQIGRDFREAWDKNFGEKDADESENKESGSPEVEPEETLGVWGGFKKRRQERLKKQRERRERKPGEYYYEAIDEDGNEVSGVVAGDSEQEVTKKLIQEGKYVTLVEGDDTESAETDKSQKEIDKKIEKLENQRFECPKCRYRFKLGTYIADGGCPSCEIAIDEVESAKKFLEKIKGEGIPSKPKPEFIPASEEPADENTDEVLRRAKEQKNIDTMGVATEDTLEALGKLDKKRKGEAEKKRILEENDPYKALNVPENIDLETLIREYKRLDNFYYRIENNIDSPPNDVKEAKLIQKKLKEAKNKIKEKLEGSIVQ